MTNWDHNVPPTAILLVGLALLYPRVLPAQSSVDIQPTTPAWVKELVVYEIATKTFTSPNGPESGTFDSLKAKLPYLQDLGVTGIWVTGHSLSDPHHFYNIWTQYAAIEPDRLDPSLGTAEQFKAMIDEAHRRGIRVFLDVITHGVMPASPLLNLHPEWFRGGSYGMADYDWDGGHLDLDEWWVKTWTDYVTRFGVDGFRLDVAIYRPDLWSRIRANATAVGHPIVVFIEGMRVIPGVTDFTQRENPISNSVTGKLNQTLVNNVPQFYATKLWGPTQYNIEIDYSDGTHATGSTDRKGELDVEVKGFTLNRATIQQARPAGACEVLLSVSGVKSTSLKNVVVWRGDSGSSDDSREPIKWTLKDDTISPIGTSPRLILYLQMKSYGSSVQLSSHDNGWEGFPLDRNPYTAQGSRALFGYSLLFTPMIPLFMAGEEFDADFHPLPNLSPDLYGGKNPGTGRWLYGGKLEWSEVERPGHLEMLNDVRRMLAIRREEHEVLASEVHGEVEPRLAAVPFTSDIDVPSPYMRWTDSEAIVVLANRNTESDAHIRLTVPLKKQGSASGKYRVTDLWNGGTTTVLSADQLTSLAYTVKRDKTAGGGIGLLKVERVDE